MNNRHKKRWCDDCKMMVFATGHEHGRVEGEHPANMVERADMARARAVVNRVFRAAKDAAMEHADAMFAALMGGALPGGASAFECPVCHGVVSKGKDHCCP